MRSFFDPHVDQILELIHGQIIQIEYRNRRTAVRSQKMYLIHTIDSSQALLLVGGFSESQYVQEELRRSIVELRNIRLYRPDTS